MEATSGNKFAVRSSQFTVKNQKSSARNQIKKLPTPNSRLPTNQGVVVAINISKKKGERKTNIGQGELLAGLGLEGDAHAGSWHRQVSLLAEESIDKMRELGLDVSSGDFAENITTRGFDLTSLPIGARLKIGEEALLELAQIGKVCHSRCAIYYQAGDCVMPKEGIFAKVLKGGQIKVADLITVT